VLTLGAYVDALRRDSSALADAAERDLTAKVPSCPDWTMADLVWHVGQVYEFWRQIAAGQLQDRSKVARRERPADPEIVAWLRTEASALAEVLAAADPSTPVYSWSAQKDIAFIQRRMPQETAVHRWDAQNAVGVPEPIDPALAADGIDEFFQLMMPSDPFTVERTTVALESTEGDAWTVTAQAGVELVRGARTADARARASASDLLLLLWRRRTPDGIEIDGDRSALERFLAITDLT